MKWKNAVRDHLPASDKNVLVSLGGVYYFAIYDTTNKVFHVNDNKRSIVLSAYDEQLYWTEITAAE